MVFQKKGGFKGKQQTPAKQKGKKPANAASFFEQESDDSENEVSVKTPGGKTPKGKQSQGDKRVSFQIPGKNTPNKTPKNENSLVKKQLTPGKPSALKEFKGLSQNSASKKSNKPTKGQADDDDDEDDDDDDDDDDLDLDMLGDDDDDDDDDDDEEDDDDDDDDDDSEDDEEDGKTPKKVQNSQQKQMNSVQKKQNNVEKNKTPSKNLEKSPEKKVLNSAEKGKVKTPQASAKSEKKDKKSLVSLKQSEEDDDDDDDDDDDEDIDMDMLLDEEDDSDDSEEEEQKSPQKKQSQMNSLQTKQIPENKTPSKKEKTPAKTPQATASPKKAEKEKPIGYQKALDLAEERKRERDVRTLFVGNLPKDVTPSELKALSNDITNVCIPPRGNSKRKFAFAFLEFVSEAKAEENLKLLKSKKLRGESLTLDYTGCKRQKNVEKDDSVQMNLKKLYVSGIPADCTIDKIAVLFPKSSQIQLNICPTYRTATVNFLTIEEAREALENTKNAKLDGKLLTILYSVARDHTKKRKRSKGKKPNAKKMKMEVQKGNDDDDDDDDDDDEEE